MTTGTVPPWGNPKQYYGPWQSIAWRPENVQKQTLTASGESFAFDVVPGLSYMAAVVGQKATDLNVDVTWGVDTDPTGGDYDATGIPWLVLDRGAAILRCPPGFNKFGVRVNKAGTWQVWIAPIE